MDTKHSKFLSALGGKCPQCRTGKMFTDRAYSFKFSRMHKNCPDCGLKYEREPHFFIGAMYIGYGISMATMIGTLVILNVLFGRMEFINYLIPMISAILLMVPVNFRGGRVLLLYLFGNVKYKNTP